LVDHLATEVLAPTQRRPCCSN